MGLALVVLVAVVNALLVNRGETVLARLGEWPVLGQVDVTAQAILAGLGIGLRALVALIAFAVYSACVDPDRVLRGLRPFARRSALTATLVSRLLPVAASDAGRLRDAARLRGPAAAEVGAGSIARRLLAGSLDRAVDVAATLELRGYGLDARVVKRRHARSRYDRRFYVIAAVLLAAAIAGKALGADDFHTYPEIELGTGPVTVALCGLLLLSGFATRPRRPRRRAAPGRLEAARV
jgi:energy-coupling factor transport system permease protein